MKTNCGIISPAGNPASGVGRRASLPLFRQWLIAAFFLTTAWPLLAQPPLEPTVSKREAAVLSEAADVAATNTAQAVALLAAANDPDASAALDFAIGNFRFQNARYEDAVEAYIEAVRKLPTFRDARKNLGRAYLVQEREQDAIRVYQKLVADGMADADVYLLLGHGLMMRRHAVQAETAYRQVLLLESDHRDAQRGLIQALLEQERFTEVRNLLRTVLDQQPQEAAYWSLLANVEVALANTAAAIRTAETARRLEACQSTLLLLLGDLYLDAGRAAEAVDRYEEARAVGGGGPARFLRAVEGLVLMGEAEKADRLLKSVEPATDSHESRLTVLRLQAEIAALRGQTARSIGFYRERIAADPLDGQGLLRLGDLLREKGDSGEAELAYERAGRVSGFEADSLVRRAQLVVDDKRYAEAVELLEAAQRVDPQPSVARYLEQIRRLDK